MEEDKATEEWLNSLKKGTRITYRYNWRRFLEFVGSTGDKILENRKADKEYSWEKKVMEFHDWLINKRKMSSHTAKTAGGVVRGFFDYHRQPLKLRRSEGARLSEATTATEDYRFSLEDLKKMFDVADLQERYVLTAGKSFGLRAGDFLALTRGDLEPYLDREVPISIGKYATQKESVPAYPFIDTDAISVIKLMIEKIDREGKVKPTNRMLTYKHTVELTRVIKRLVERAGIKVGTKRVRFHCMRKFLIDHLSSFMSESKWKQIVGKKISESAYVSPDTLKEDYTRAMDETCFMKRYGEGDIQKMAKKEALKAIAKSMGITERQMKTMFTRKPGNIDEEIEFIEKIIESERAKAEDPNDCPNGEHCTSARYEEIGEGELLQHLRQGWQIVHRLENGRIIVKR